MKSLNQIKESLNEAKLKKGDIVTIKPEFSDSEDDGKFELLANPSGGRVKIVSLDTNLSMPPVENVKVEWLIKEYMTNSTQVSSKKLVYRDIPAGEKKKLDSICMNKFSKKFLDCSFEEQSAARSYYYSDEEEIDTEEEKVTKQSDASNKLDTEQ